MKQFKEFMAYLILGFIALNLFGYLFCTGESFPQPKMTEKAVYYLRVPASSAISP